MTKIDTHTRLKDLSAKQTAETEEDFPAIVLFLCFFKCCCCSVQSPIFQRKSSVIQSFERRNCGQGGCLLYMVRSYLQLRRSGNCLNLQIWQTPWFPNALARGGRQKVDIYFQFKFGINSGLNQNGLKWQVLPVKESDPGLGSKGLIYAGLEFGILEFAWRTILRIAHSL